MTRAEETQRRQCFSDPCPIRVLLELRFQSRSCQLRKQTVARCPGYSWVLPPFGLCIWTCILLPGMVRRGLCSLIVALESRVCVAVVLSRCCFSGGAFMFLFLVFCWLRFWFFVFTRSLKLLRLVVMLSWACSWPWRFDAEKNSFCEGHGTCLLWLLLIHYI